MRHGGKTDNLNQVGIINRKGRHRPTQQQSIKLITMGQVFKNFIDEVKHITGEAVAQKQESAKLNFPKIKELILAAAQRGESEVRVSTYIMNEYDKELLTKECFTVHLVDRERPPSEDAKNLYAEYAGLKRVDKEWLIRW